VEELTKAAANTGGKIIYSDFDRIDEKGRNIDTHRELDLGYEEFCATLWLAGRWFIGNGSSILIHVSCFNKVGLFDEKLRFQEDYDWWLRASIIHGYRFIHVPKVLLKYRIHRKQLTATVSHNSIVNSEMIKKRVRKHIVTINPERWHDLSRNFRYYNRYRGVTHGLRMVSRRMLIYLPSQGRKSILSWWLYMKRFRRRS
jgi:GT2 family glycosyltransferase